MTTEIRIGKSQVTDTFGMDAVVRLKGGENIFTLRGNSSFTTDYTWILMNRINQLGNMLNIHNVIVISDIVDEYCEYYEELYSKADILIDLNKANNNPAWFITVTEKLIRNKHDRGICYILIDCKDKVKYHKTLEQFEATILNQYKKGIVVNYVVDTDEDIRKATTNDIIEINGLPEWFSIDELFKFTNLDVLAYVQNMQNSMSNEVIVIHKEHAIKVKPYIN